ncbi:MAG: 2-oxoacid:acceptor oxidoreductase family protein [Desulfurococcales archaeon]|nr:2-oxoacid:acceptor oxidoreductase family protein [Desulfurococcales archaeon]
MRKEFLASGRGGQGILLLGHVLGLAVAKYTELYVTGTESYDSETRGGDSKIDLIIADRPDELDYFKVRRAGIALFMYPDQMLKYKHLVRPDATVFLDTTFCTEPAVETWEVVKAPYTDIAEKELGAHVVANMVALGHVIKRTGLIPPDAVVSSIQEVVRRRWVSIDIKAFKKGLSLP